MTWVIQTALDHKRMWLPQIHGCHSKSMRRAKGTTCRLTHSRSHDPAASLVKHHCLAEDAKLQSELCSKDTTVGAVYALSLDVDPHLTV